MIIKKELIKRQIAAETILVPVGKTVYDSHGLFVLNELGEFIWELLPNVQPEAEIEQDVLKEYEVTADVAAKDVAEFMAALQKLEII